MNFRATAILGGVILAAVAGLLIYSLVGTDSTPDSGILLAELAGAKPEDITTVEIERSSGGPIVFTRQGTQRWTVRWEAKDAAGQSTTLEAWADNFTVNDIVRELLAVKPTPHPELTGNPALHGLEPAGLKVTLRASDDRAASVQIGDVLAGGRGVAFVMTDRYRRPLAIPRSALDPLLQSGGRGGQAVDLLKSPSEFRNKSVFPVESFRAEDETTRIELALEQQKKSVQLEKSGGQWVFVQPQGWGAADVSGDPLSAATFTGVRPLLNALTSLRVASATDFLELPTPEQLREHGLSDDSPGRIRVTLRFKDGTSTTVDIGKPDAVDKKDAPPAPADAKYWVRIHGQPGIMRVGGANLNGLAPLIDNPDPLRDRNLLTVERVRIDGIDLSTGVTLRRVGTAQEWKLYGPPTPTEPQATDRTAVQRLLDVLTERRIIRSFPPRDDARFSGNALQVEIQVWADAFEPPADDKSEPKRKEKAQPIRLLVGRKEGDAVAVRRILPDGTTSDFLVPEKVKIGAAPETVDFVAAVRKSRLELLDPSLPTFSNEAVERLQVSGAAAYELYREAKSEGSGPRRWLFAAPEARKGQSADAETVEELLRLVGTTQSASRIISEQPSEEQLKEYGLAPTPQLKVTVTLTSGDDRERVYEFGKVTADPGQVYARVGGRNRVYALPKHLFDRFTTAELRDRGQLRFVADQATEVRLKGWGKAGFVTELHFVKSGDGQWKPQSPPTPAGFMLDPAKLTALVQTLSGLTIKSFLDGKDKPEYGIEDAKEYLHITVKLADGSERQLKVGAAASGGAELYAWTSLGGGQLLTIDAAPLKMYRDSPGALAR